MRLLIRPARFALAALVLLVPLAAFARGADSPMSTPGTLPTLRVKGDAGLELPLRHTDVKAEVSGFVARFEVTQVFTNAQPTAIEAIYTFPLPEHAAVEGFTLRAGDREIEAEIHKRAEATRIYEQATSAGNTAALLEQERTNIFTQSVANLPPGEEVKVTIRFSELLAYDNGEYELAFPLVVGPRYVPGSPSGEKSGTGTRADTEQVPDASRISPPVIPAGTRSGHDVSISVELEAGFPIAGVETPSHEVIATRASDSRFHVQLSDRDAIPNRDFILRWRVASDSPQTALLAHRTDATGAFALVVQPPSLDVNQLVGQREILFVVDVSGSMWGLPLYLCQEAMRSALSRLRPDDTFDILTFSGATRHAFTAPRRATPENISDALSFVEQMRAGGGTEMLSAVTDALAPNVEAGRRRYVFFMTDGFVGNDEILLGAAHRYAQGLLEKNETGRVFSFGVGSAPNRALLDGLAREGNGASVYASNREDPRRGVDAFFRRIDHPILENVSVDWGSLEVKDVTPQVTPDLIASRPLILQGRYEHAGKSTIHIRAESGSGERIDIPLEVTLPEREDANPSLETLWARAQVEEVSDAMAFDRFDGRGDNSSVREKQIEELGLRYHLVTRFTSLVAVDKSRVIGEGKPRTVVQPVETPEDVDAKMAGAEEANLDEGKMGHASYGSVHGASAGYGGMALSGVGQGGGGVGQTVTLGSIGTRGQGRGQGAYASGSGFIGLGGKAAEARPEEDAAAAPRVASGNVRVTGSIDREAIRRFIRAHLRELRACYEHELSRSPALAGSLTVKFTLAADGSVTAAEISNRTLSSPELESCVLARWKRWHFSAASGATTISYPLSFSPPS